MTIAWWLAVAALTGAVAAGAVRGFLTINGRPLRETPMTQDEDIAEGMRHIGQPAEGMLMDTDFNDEDGCQILHRRNVAHIQAYARARAAHVRHVPECDAAPLCGGPAVGATITFRDTLQPGYVGSLTFSAIAIVADLNAEIADLRAQLMSMDADLVDALGNLGDTQAELGAALAQLAACDAMLGDAVPPVLPVEE